MDTTAIDWFPNERQMIEWLAEDVHAGPPVPANGVALVISFALLAPVGQPQSLRHNRLRSFAKIIL
jgi:hypothetical protein